MLISISNTYEKRCKEYYILLGMKKREEKKKKKKKKASRALPLRYLYYIHEILGPKLVYRRVKKRERERERAYSILLWQSVYTYGKTAVLVRDIQVLPNSSNL